MHLVCGIPTPTTDGGETLGPTRWKQPLPVINTTEPGRGGEGSRLSLKTQAAGEMKTFYML